MSSTDTPDPLRPSIGDVLGHFGLSVADVLSETDAPDEIVAEQLGLDPSRLGPGTSLAYLAYEAELTPGEIVEQVPSIRIIQSDDIDRAVRFVRRKAPTGRYDDGTIQDAMELVAADAAFGKLTGGVRGEVVTQVQEGEGMVQFESMNNIEPDHSSLFMAEAIELIPELDSDDFWSVAA